MRKLSRPIELSVSALAARRPKSRNSTERELAEIVRKIARLVAEIENGSGSKSVSQRIAELEAEREAGEERLATFSSPEVVELHPRAAERYRQKSRGYSGCAHGWRPSQL